MAAGIAKELQLCSSNSTASTTNALSGARPSWCDTSLRSDLVAAQTRLWNSINGASAEKFSEVWSWNFDQSTDRFSVEDLGVLAPEGTESDAVQLVRPFV